MQILITHYAKKHLPLLKELAKVLEFKLSKYPPEPLEINKAIFAAMEESRNAGLLSEKGRQDFERLLYNK